MALICGSAATVHVNLHLCLVTMNKLYSLYNMGNLIDWGYFHWLDFSIACVVVKLSGHTLAHKNSLQVPFNHLIHSHTL